MSELAKNIGLVCFAAGFVCYVAAFFYLKPGQSIVEAFMRGSFARSRDYEPRGRMLLMLMRVLGWVGIALVFAGVRELFGS